MGSAWDRKRRAEGSPVRAMNAKIRVLVDVDGVLADFPAAVLQFCNTYGCAPGARPWVLEDVKEHDILKALRLEHLQERLDTWCADTDMCRSLPLYDGAQAFVEELKSFAEVVIVTASYGAVPNWNHARLAWLEEHFGIDKADVVFAKRKELVAGNMLIDDKLRNIDAWRNAWGHQGCAAVFDRPWNRGIQYRVQSYAEALECARGVGLLLAKRAKTAGVMV